LFFKEQVDDSPSTHLAEGMMDETADEDFQVFIHFYLFFAYTWSP
jgi:hypothetical protein